MAKTDYQSIDEYHKVFTGEALSRMERIRAMVHQIAPQANELISYQIPAFKIGKKFFILYCAFPKHITISNPWSAEFLAAFEHDLKGYKVSKSAIQLPLDKPLPIDLIERILKFRLDEVTFS